MGKAAENTHAGLDELQKAKVSQYQSSKCLITLLFISVALVTLAGMSIFGVFGGN